MIVVRNIFQLKFGKAKEAIALWKQAGDIAAAQGYGEASSRLLTDLVGPPFYTLIFETTFESMDAYEQASKELMADGEWQTLYAQMQPLVEEGRREILTIVE